MDVRKILIQTRIGLFFNSIFLPVILCQLLEFFPRVRDTDWTQVHVMSFFGVAAHVSLDRALVQTRKVAQMTETVPDLEMD